MLTTPAGEYTCRVAIFAIGMAEPWRPSTPGIEAVPHYVETGPVEAYAGKRVFTVGKQNSAFEIATALLPWARQIVMASPRPAKLSVVEHALTGVRARYVQPYEDAFLANGVYLLDMRIEGIERAGEGFRIRMRGSTDGREMAYEADAVIATTGFAVPLGDLPALGVATFSQGKMPAVTPLWESVSVPGIFFAGTISQAAGGLKKHGIPANSGAVHGHRYNSRVLVRHIARTVFGKELARPALSRDALVPYLAEQLTVAPELWNQRSYLAQVVSVDAEDGFRDEGILPLALFVDAPGPDAVAVTMEPTAEGHIYPAVYLRRNGSVTEHLLDPHPLNDFRGPAHMAALDAIHQAVDRLTPPCSARRSSSWPAPIVTAASSCRRAPSSDDGAVACADCARSYEVRDGVAILLAAESEDTWRDSAAQLDAALGADPAAAQRLLRSPLDELNGADLTFRGMVLEARGELERASAAFAAADAELYGTGLRACRDRLLDACVDRLGSADWVLDVASGRGALVERMARAGRRVVATDISAVAMIRLRARLAGLGLADRVDCVACDAGALPLRDATVPLATSFLGLQNIARPARVLGELRRVCAGPMLTVGHTYPQDDVNGTALREHGYGHVADRSVLDAMLAAVGWRPTYPELCSAAAAPTPLGEVVSGGAVDGFPVAPTTLRWHLLEAH